MFPVPAFVPAVPLEPDQRPVPAPVAARIRRTTAALGIVSVTVGALGVIAPLILVLTGLASRPSVFWFMMICYAVVALAVLVTGVGVLHVRSSMMGDSIDITAIWLARRVALGFWWFGLLMSLAGELATIGAGEDSHLSPAAFASALITGIIVMATSTMVTFLTRYHLPAPTNFTPRVRRPTGMPRR